MRWDHLQHHLVTNSGFRVSISKTIRVIIGKKSITKMKSVHDVVWNGVLHEINWALKRTFLYQITGLNRPLIACRSVHYKTDVLLLTHIIKAQFILIGTLRYVCQECVHNRNTFRMYFYRWWSDLIYLTSFSDKIKCILPTCVSFIRICASPALLRAIS